MKRYAAVLLFLCMLLCAFTCGAADTGNAQQSPLGGGPAQAKKYPRIVLYSVAWCPHCRQAKEYFTKNNIPFINKDVEVDDKAMDELTKKYKSQGVPVIVIGNDEKVLRGFDQEQLEKALKEVSK